MFTSGSKGIGKVKINFLDHGAKVLICVRNRKDLKNPEHELKNDVHISHTTADLTQIDDISRIKIKLKPIMKK